jgi:putative endonuclease
MVTVYVLRSLTRGIRYVGITSQIGTRLRAHARGESKGGQQLGPFELIHREEFPSYQEARGREKFLKSGIGRQWLDDTFGRKPVAHSNVRSEPDADLS